MPTSDPVKICFAVLSVYERNGWIHPSILQFFCDMPFKTGYAFRMIPVHNFIPAASGRNMFCKAIKDNEADWVCMIDNDMAVPDNLLDAVKDAPADADIVVPTFYMWDQTNLKLTLCWGMEGVPSGYARLNPGYHELTKCGTGVIFIRPRVFQGMEYPYFRYLYDDNGNQTGTEDVQFCLSAREKGFKIYGTTAVKVGHYHSVELSSMWDWAEKTFEHLKTEKKVDTEKEVVVKSPQKDSGCSPEAPAEEGVPLEAT